MCRPDLPLACHGTASGVERERKKKKPGQIRRDQNRFTAFLERRRQAAKVPEAARTDEIMEEEVEDFSNTRYRHAAEKEDAQSSWTQRAITAIFRRYW